MLLLFYSLFISPFKINNTTSLCVFGC